MLLPEQALEIIEAAPQVVVAYSGGCDSQALLDMVRHSRPPGDWLLAVHVNHNLAPEAGQWLEHCAESCRRWGIGFKAESVDARRPRGASMEAHARKLRYQALASHLAPGGALLLAHHADDQAETMLLQALRGAGVDGMAAMPFARDFAAGIMLRPLLAVTRSEIRRYAARSGLDWVEDPSNMDQSHDRNYIRHTVLPAMASRWPNAVGVLAAGCARLGAARRLLEAQAMEDLGGSAKDSVDIGLLRRLGPDRACNIFRHWLRSRGLTTPTELCLREMLRQFLHAAADAHPSFRCGKGSVLRRYQQRVYLLPPQAEVPADAPWQLDKPLPLPWGSLRAAAAAAGSGLDPEQPCMVRFRRGGELLDDGTALKRFLQRRRVLPWWRDRLPLLCAGDRVIAIPGLWCSPRRKPPPHRGGVEVHWDGAPELVAPGLGLQL